MTAFLIFAGFVFSEDEPTALMQFDGGPCAVIAPVQSYVIRQAFFSENPVDNLSTLTGMLFEMLMKKSISYLPLLVSQEKL